MAIRSALSLAIAKEKCKNLKVGDKVTIKETVKDTGNGRTGTIKTPGIILGKFPNLILLERGTNHKTKECFTYIDIAITGCIEKKMGRPSRA